MEFYRTYFSSKADDSLGSRRNGHTLFLWNCTEFMCCLQGHFFSTANCCWIAPGSVDYLAPCFQWVFSLQKLQELQKQKNFILHLACISSALQTDYCTILQTSTKSLQCSKAHKRKSGRKAFFPETYWDTESDPKLLQECRQHCSQSCSLQGELPRPGTFHKIYIW